jgi:hypothetical protein
MKDIKKFRELIHSILRAFHLFLGQLFKLSRKLDQNESLRFRSSVKTNTGD